MDDDAPGHGSQMGKKGISEPEMYANSFSITIAGSEGTATALAGATFLLLRHPGQYQRAVNEVRGAFRNEAEITSSRICARVPFIEAVLQEAMRLYPPVSITMPRRVPEGGAIIDGRFVAAGTTVGVNHLSCYRSSSNFENAMEFRPERWLRSNGKEASHGDDSLKFADDKKEAMRKFWSIHSNFPLCDARTDIASVVLELSNQDNSLGPWGS